MVKPLCYYTVCQVVTLRDVGTSWYKKTKATQIKIKIQSTVCIQPLLEKQQFRGPKIEQKTHQIVKKIKKK